MRLALIAVALLMLAAGAQAKPAADPKLRLVPPPSENAIAMGARGAILESDYFKSPSQHVTSGSACRMYFDPFEKERLAAVCR